MVFRVPAVVLRCHWERRNPVQLRRTGEGRYPVRRMMRQHTWFLDSGLRRNDGLVRLRLRLFGSRPGCRDVTAKGATRLTVVVSAQAGTQCGGWCSDTRGFSLPACAGMTGGLGFGCGCSGLGGGVAMSLPEAQPRSVSSYRRRPVPSAAFEAGCAFECGGALNGGGRRADHVSAVAHLQAALRCAPCVLDHRHPWGVQQR